MAKGEIETKAVQFVKAAPSHNELPSTIQVQEVLKGSERIGNFTHSKLVCQPLYC